MAKSKDMVPGVTWGWELKPLASATRLIRKAEELSREGLLHMSNDRLVSESKLVAEAGRQLKVDLEAARARRAG